MVAFNFDATQVKPNEGYTPLPAGWYNVAIDSSDVQETKDKTGAMLVMTAKVIDGPEAGKPVFIRLNIQNQNQKAQDIAYADLSAICHVTGVYNIQDSSQLHGIPFQVKVNVRKSEEYGDSNDVKGYKDAQGNDPGKAGSGAVGAAQPMQAAPTAQQPAAPQQPPAQVAPQQAAWGQQPAQAPAQPQPGYVPPQPQPAPQSAAPTGMQPPAQQAAPVAAQPPAQQPYQQPATDPNAAPAQAPWGTPPAG